VLKPGELAVERRRPPSGIVADEEGQRLVEAALRGDAAAFEALVDRHWRKIASIAGRFLSDPNEIDDALQETFISAFRNLSRFRGEASVQTWLIRIAINVCKGRRTGWWRRRVRLETEHSAAADTDRAPTSAASVESEVLYGEWERTVRCAVGRLPERQRLPILLHFFEDLTGAEIARVLGCSESTVWSRLYAGIENLRKTLGPWMETETESETR